jgi:hypothetical protein
MTSDENDGKAPLHPGAATPKFGMIGPTVEDDIRRAISKYGKTAVKAAVAELTKPRKGRPDEKDWPGLRHIMEADAREWLDGGDPFATRTNYSIAKEFADRQPGQSHPSTMKRIERKLAKKPYDRRWYMLVTAEHIARDSYPHSDYIHVLEELSAGDYHDVWSKMLTRAHDQVARYAEINGSPPSPNVPMRKIESVYSDLLINPKPIKPISSGLFGAGLLGGGLLNTDGSK